MERVQRALRADERDSVYALSSLEVPPCWRPGLGLESPCEADVAAITVRTREHEQNVDREQDGPPKPKRVKVQPPPEAVQWFLVWSAHMWEHHGWPQAQSLGTAASWPPEVFGGINRSSIYRWKLSARDLQGALPICSRAVNSTPTNTARTELHSMITFLIARTRVAQELEGSGLHFFVSLKHLSSTCHVSLFAAPDTDHKHKFSLTHFIHFSCLSDGLTLTNKPYDSQPKNTLRCSTAEWRINTNPISHRL